MSLLSELDQFSKIENPEEADFWNLYAYTSKLSESLKEQRKADSRLNKKNRRIRSRLTACEMLLEERGVDPELIRRRMQS